MSRNGASEKAEEGCLSIPGYVAYITRRERVWVVGQNRFGRRIKVAGSGLLGRALQHELDHLDGKLYIPDRKLSKWVETNPPRHTEWTTEMKR